MLVIKFHFSRAIRSRIGYLLLILVSNRVLPGVVESQKSAFRVSDPRVSEQAYYNINFDYSQFQKESLTVGKSDLNKTKFIELN